MSNLTVKNWWDNLLPSEQYSLELKYKTDNIYLIYEKEFKFNIEETEL